MTRYCFDTDVLSATVRPAPLLHFIRRLATVLPQDQFTISITVGELIYGARRVGRENFSRWVEQIVCRAQTVLPFDLTAARTFGALRQRWNVVALRWPNQICASPQSCCRGV